ncbi:MAG: hypothetical protein OQK24_02210 [Magnetovibrio sp.]|nr:hypothetical protein [Magnetovibrio sp.]
MDNEAPKPLEHPWLKDKNFLSKTISPLSGAVDDASQEQDVYDLAAGLKTAIRDDRIRRTNDAKKK